MDVFDLRDQLIGDYRRYVASFMAMRDRRIRERVQSRLDEGRLWRGPRIGLNPAFKPGGSSTGWGGRRGMLPVILSAEDQEGTDEPTTAVLD